MVAQPSGEQVYATLLLNDAYLAGALVLAHSLRDCGTTKKLAVLVTLDSVTEQAVEKLKTVYDHVIPVPRIRNEKPANLHLMNRTDLHSAFTKIQLWKLSQFSRVVYIDADVVAYRAPDELFNIPHSFGAAPDIGWPDIFNTGVMVLSPNPGDYYAMCAMAERGISFDGADQGLLNQFFGSNYHRLPFTYNVTPSAHYQYLPAYRHFQSSINMVHFIGANKPWSVGRHASFGSGAYDEMIGRWWAVFDRHYYGQDAYTIAQSTAESWSNSAQGWDASRQAPSTSSGSEATGSSPVNNTAYQSHGYNYQFAPIFPWEGSQPRPARAFFGDLQPTQAPALSALVAAAAAASTPVSAPAPAPAPAPASARTPAPAPAATRTVSAREAERPRLITEASEVKQEGPADPESYEREPQSPVTAPSVSEMDTTDNQSEAVTPTTPTRFAHSAPWTSYPRMNAWDDVPGINRYVEGFEKYRRQTVKSLKGAAAQTSPSAEAQEQSRGTKVTDFPSEAERPSLPVTPAPVRRSSFWSQGDSSEAGSDGRMLPEAEGVPDQSEWVCTHGLRWSPTDCLCDMFTDVVIHHKDPVEQLQKLAAQQSEALLRRLGGEAPEEEGEGDENVPKLLSPRPVKGVTTLNLERKMQKGEHPTDARPVTWDEDEATEFSFHEREALDA